MNGDRAEQAHRRRHVEDRPEAQQPLQCEVRVELHFLDDERLQVGEPIAVLGGNERLDVMKRREAPLTPAVRVDEVRPRWRKLRQRGSDL